jgi:hypothetical protein
MIPEVIELSDTAKVGVEYVEDVIQDESQKLQRCDSFGTSIRHCLVFGFRQSSSYHAAQQTAHRWFCESQM